MYNFNNVNMHTKQWEPRPPSSNLSADNNLYHSGSFYNLQYIVFYKCPARQKI